MTKSLAPIVLGLVAMGATLLGCAAGGVPDPRLASADYADAVKRGDITALYAMLDAESRRAVSRDEFAALFATSKAELIVRARELSKNDLRVETLAEVVFADGERAQLVIEDGRARVRAAGAFPTGARSPVDALAEFRAVLARRSYAGLVRVLSSDSQGALEQQLRSLVTALEQPETLEIRLEGDEATVVTPGGHQVVLRREDGVWKVHDFE